MPACCKREAILSMMNRLLVIIAVLLVGTAGCGYLGTDEAAYRSSRSLPQLKRPDGVEIPPPNHTYRVPVAEPAEQAPAEKPVSPARQNEKPLPVFVEPDKAAQPKTAVVPVPKVQPKPAAVPAQKEEAQRAEAIPIFVERQQLTKKMSRPVEERSAPKAATTRNWFVVDAPPEKVWAKLVSYWMQRRIPLVESNPITGRIVTDWVPALDERLRQQGIRDQFELLLERHSAGSRITLRHRASRKTAVKGDRPAWALLGVDEALQGAETVRLRDYLTGK